MPIIKKCPVCGIKPVIKPYPNNLGYEVQCINKDCEMWGHKLDLDGWNNRAVNIYPVIDKFITAEIADKVGFLYTCRECGKTNKDWRLIHHERDCKSGKFIRSLI